MTVDDLELWPSHPWAIIPSDIEVRRGHSAEYGGEVVALVRRDSKVRHVLITPDMLPASLESIKTALTNLGVA